MKRFLLFALIAAPFVVPNVAGASVVQVPSGVYSSSKAFDFRVAVQPLLNAEWWASIAVACQFRHQPWLASVEVAIDHQAIVAAQTIWGGNSAPIGPNVRAFISMQARFRNAAANAPSSECNVLLSAGELGVLDQMTAKHDRTNQAYIFSERPHRNDARRNGPWYL